MKNDDFSIYHFFIKKYGLVNGIFIWAFISAPLLVLFTVLLADVDIGFAYFIAGLMIALFLTRLRDYFLVK